jgi:hypothetical protein
MKNMQFLKTYAKENQFHKNENNQTNSRWLNLARGKGSYKSLLINEIHRALQKTCQKTSIFKRRKQFKQFPTVELSKGERFTQLPLTNVNH